MNKLLGTWVGDSANSNQIVGAHEAASDELPKFFVVEESSALFPNLSWLAKQWLTVNATSVPSKRVFSKSGRLVK